MKPCCAGSNEESDVAVSSKTLHKAPKNQVLSVTGKETASNPTFQKKKL